MAVKNRLLWAALSGALLVGAQAAAAGGIAEARALMDRGNARAALEILKPMEAERAGEPGYDYLLGIAALDAGEPGLAVFALERAVAVEPDNAQARAELARAYFMLRDDELARQELENVKAMAPPRSVQATINEYLDALDQRFEALRTHVSVYAELGVGYDTNINSASDRDDFVFPPSSPVAFLNPAVNTAPEENAPFVVAELGGGVTHSITPDLFMFVRGRMEGRENLDGEEFDERTLGADVGLRYLRGANTFTGTLSGEKFYLDGVSFRSIGGLSLQWQHVLDARNQVTGFARVANLRYHQSATYPGNPFNDADQRMLGVAWGHQFGGTGSPTLYTSLYVADEDERRDVATSVNGVATRTSGLVARDFWGLRVGGQYSYDSDWDLVGSLTAQFSDYDDIHPTFTDREREDDYYRLMLGANYKLGTRWLVRPRLTYTNNDSNVPLSDYDRWQAFVTARYMFK